MEINVLIEEEYRKYLDESWLKQLAEKILKAQAAGGEVEVGIMITSQDKIKELNATYRGIDDPTDVLSFAMLMETLEEGKTLAETFINPPDGVRHLGEVIISYPQSRIQAEEHNHTVNREIIILVLHGILHLFGYDHEDDEMEREMRTREAELLAMIEGGEG